MIPVLVLAGVMSAAAAQSGGPPVGEIVDPVACVADPDQTYALYLSTAVAEAPDGRRHPVLLLLDPRSRGRRALELFQAGAERHGWIVLSSNRSRSDAAEDHNGPAFAALLREAVDEGRYPVDPNRVYMAGMSGTARFGWVAGAAMKGRVAGVISIGGGLPGREPGWLDDVRFAFFGAAGTVDFNYDELVALDEALDDLGVRHHVEFFEGRHGWAPPEVHERAIGWMELEAMRSGRRPVDRELAAGLFEESLEAAESRGGRGDAVLLGALEQLLTDYRGLVGLEAVGAEVERLRADPEVAAAREAHAAAVAAEQAWVQKLNEVLAELLQVDRRPPPLPRLMSRLRIDALLRQAEQAGLEGESAHRMLESAYVQLSFYLPRELRRRGEDHAAVLPLELATRLYPERPVAWYDLACARAQAGRRRAAVEAFETAVDVGFAWAGLAARDPDLDPIRSRDRFRAAFERIGGEVAADTPRSDSTEP